MGLGGAEEDKLLEPVNLVHRKLLPISKSHSKYYEKFTHKSTSMTKFKYSARNMADLSGRSNLNLYQSSHICFLLNLSENKLIGD